MAPIPNIDPNNARTVPTAAPITVCTYATAVQSLPWAVSAPRRRTEHGRQAHERDRMPVLISVQVSPMGHQGTDERGRSSEDELHGVIRLSPRGGDSAGHRERRRGTEMERGPNGPETAVSEIILQGEGRQWRMSGGMRKESRD